MGPVVTRDLPDCGNRAKQNDSRPGITLIGLGAYSLGADSKGAYTVGAYSLSHRFWVGHTTHWTWGLQYGGVQSGGQEFPATRSTHWIGGVKSGGLQYVGQQSQATDFRPGKPLILSKENLYPFT